MDTDHPPRLVQRVLLRRVENAAAKGLDRFFSFDCMGSAEFEFGALPATVKLLRERKAADDVVGPIEIAGVARKTAWYVGPEDQQKVAKKLFIAELLYGDSDPMVRHIKDPTYMRNAYGVGDGLIARTPDGWLCVDAGYKLCVDAGYKKSRERGMWALFVRQESAEKWLECL